MSEFCFVLSQESDDGQIKGPVVASASWPSLKEEAVAFMTDCLSGDGDYPLGDDELKLIAEFRTALEAARPTPSLHVEFPSMDPALTVTTCLWAR